MVLLLVWRIGIGVTGLVSNMGWEVNTSIKHGWYSQDVRPQCCLWETMATDMSPFLLLRALLDSIVVSVFVLILVESDKYAL